MKVLNRPMFRYGGPIKEGIMSGIKEPRQGYRFGKGVDRTVGGAQMVFPAEITSMMPNDASKVFANVAQAYEPIDSNVNTTDRYITVDRKQPRSMNTVTQTIKNPDYIPRYKTVKGPRIGERKIEITEDMENTTGMGGASGTDMPPMLDQSGKMGAIDKVDATKDNTDPIPEKTKKERVNTILESLGYDRAQKNALYDAMIKAGQRISRTGLGAENLVSDVIAETSQSYDKPEKLREAANLMDVQQQLKLEQIKESKDNRPNIQKLAEYYQSDEGGGYSEDIAIRMARNLPTKISEYFTASKAATDQGKTRDATRAATEDGLFGSGIGYKGKIDVATHDSLSDFLVSDDLKTRGDGVYNVKGEAIVIKDGKVVSRLVIQAQDDKKG